MKIVFITGDLASGKSTLAESLKEKYGFLAIRKDEIKEYLADTIGFSNREENLALSKKTAEIMLAKLVEGMKEKKDIVIEANFRTEEMEKIACEVNKYNYPLFAYKLIGDYQVLYQRFMSRLPTRHPAHKSLHLDESIDKYIDYVNYIREQIIPFEYQQIDITSLNPCEVLSIVENDIYHSIIINK